MIAGLGEVNVKHCAITSVFKSSSGSSLEKLAQSRLLAIYFLKVTEVVEQILELKLEVVDSRNIAASFRGTRQRIYSNEDPSRIEVLGTVAI